MGEWINPGDFHYRIISASNEWAWSVLLNPTIHPVEDVTKAELQIDMQIKGQTAFLNACLEEHGREAYASMEDTLSKILLGTFHHKGM